MQGGSTFCSVHNNVNQKIILYTESMCDCHLKYKLIICKNIKLFTTKNQNQAPVELYFKLLGP